ncbi:MAG: ribonuclease, Rne/Rng family [Fibrobacteres bacterium]|nr:ribonuclease, Rne/Rng family [Fibrobacterota bacterium]
MEKAIKRGGRATSNQLNRPLKSKREILINVRPYEKRIAILEDGRLAEIVYERPESNRLVGNIYKGVVNAVLPGLQAAFVDIGLEKAGFLHVEDVAGRPNLEDYDDDEGDARPAPRQDEGKTIDQLLKTGQEILVQVTKEPISTKGPRLTAHLSFAGRFLVCMPGTDFIGVSKKSRDPQQRRTLKKLIRDLKSPECGYIVRTIGLNESENEFGIQMKQLEGKWETCKAQSELVQAPSLVHQESDSSETTLRDYFSEDVDAVWIDDKTEHKTVVSFLKVLSADMVDKVKLYEGDLSLFDHFGIEEELEKTFARRVQLKRGGYLIIDQTEALVSIDVNTGGKVRGRDQGKNIVETNIDAAWEVAKQMRLRDLGGLIVVDFIDMDSEEDKENVVREFKKAIRIDKSPVSFSNLSQFGLMEITRKRVRPNVVKEQSNVCPTCKGDGYIPSMETVVGSIDRWLRRFRAKRGEKEITMALHPQMIAHVVENRGVIVKYWERSHNIRIQLVEDENSNFSEFRIFSTGSGDEITQAAAER